jgi:1,2-diacylglycerol 3-alpha-glucosyltransferase
LSHLNEYLEKKLMDGIIVTGEKMKNYYLNYTSSVFNANEIDLNIFKNPKYDSYNSKFFNIIFCGRISKEKNIDEILYCLYKLNQRNIQFIFHIIGDGPYKNDLVELINNNFHLIKSNIIFHYNLSHNDIYKLYQKLNDRIFIFASESETFGKTPMEAGATGIPIFIKKCENSNYLYKDKENAFLFDNPEHFIKLFEYFINLNIFDKEKIIKNSIHNINLYNQNKIFNDWVDFLKNNSNNNNLNDNNLNINFFDYLTLFGISKFINCTGNVIGEP